MSSSNLHHHHTKMADHDRMLRQAIYNTGANVFVVLAGFGVVALYWVLESFFRPLMWAILCGAFLHPFKHRVTRNVKSWLTGLQRSRTPFALGMFMIPFNILDSSSESIIQSVWKRWRVILAVMLVFSALYITYIQVPMDFKQFTAFLWDAITAVSDIISCFSFKWVCALVVCYLITVFKFWSDESRKLLSYLAIPIWLLLLLCVIANAGALRLPLAIAIIGFMAVGINSDRKSEKDKLSALSIEQRVNDSDDAPENDDEEDMHSKSTDVSFAQQFHSFSNVLLNSFNRTASSLTAADTTESCLLTELDDGETCCSSMISGETDGLEKTDSGNTGGGGSGGRGRGSGGGGGGIVSSDGKLSEPDTQDEKTVDFVEDIPAESTARLDKSPPDKLDKSRRQNLSRQQSMSEKAKRTRRRSDKCFIFLFWAIVLVIVWSNVRLILLPFIAVLYRIVKSIGIKLKQSLVDLQVKNKSKIDSVKEYCQQRLGVIAPAPIREMIRMVLRGDNKLIEILLNSVDTFITITLILLLLVGFVILSIAICFQVQKEGIHLITVTSNLVQNNTVQPQWLTDMVPMTGSDNSSAIHSQLDPVIKNIYTFGREWIVSQIAERISHEPSRKLLESELINIWDSLYESWVTKNATALSKPNYDGALFSHIKNGGVNYMWQDISVNISGIVNFIRENIGLFQSVVESVWILVKGNVNLVFTLLISLLQVILGGSTAILNSVLSLIVFFTTLFYLLASSSNDYKPVEWISKLTIAKSGSKFAQAVEDGIGGVFAASLKMAAFYGVYTWLTHTVFGINIVFLPSVLAAILGAIPFVGTYWASLPAVLELCLIHREVFLAFLLAVFHVLPTFVVDTALYSDINGGGHPYLTGLAIAGGIYCFGLQGAIIGPVLLCCIIVSINLYSAVINPDQPSTTPSTPGSQTILSRFESALKRSRNDGIKRSVSTLEM